MFNSYSNSGSQTRLVTPPITTTGTTSVDVEFQWYFYLTGGAGSYLTEGVQVQYSTNGSTWTNAGSLIRRYGAVTGWSLQTVTLPAGAANQATVYVGFLFTSNAGYDSYLDAVVIKPSPSCMPPTALTASSISYTSATISWTAPALGTPAGYQWEVRTSGAAGSGATGLAASGTTTIPTVTANVTGLVGATTYTYYVRTDCGGSDYSIWASNTFNTLSCNIPTSVTSSAITTTTATISWTAPVVGSPAGYEYEVRTSGAAGSGATGLAASGTTTSPTVSANLVGLSSGTTYSVYVRTNCSTGFYSAWTVAVNFNTTCNDIAAFPWTQNFDAMGSIGNSIIPSCWKIESGSGTPWYSANAASITYNDPASAPNYIYCNWTPSATDKYLITPGFSLTAGTSYDFSFNFAGDGYTGWTADVRYNTTQTGTGSTIMGAAFLAPATTSTATYAQVTRTFVAPSSATYYFIVHVNNDGIPYDLGFDDFRFEPTPTCFTPTALTSSAITNTTATISWTASVPAPANGYQYEVRTSGAAGSGATGLVTSGNTAAGIVTKNITGLISNTSYSVYVRGDCGAGDYSSWTTAHVFTTVYVAPVPYLEPFATTTTPTGYNITAWTIGSVRGVTGNPGNNIYKNLYSSATTGTFTTVNIGTVPANAKLTFDYKLANYNSPYGVPAANSGNFSVSISTDFGGSYTVLETITNNGIAGWQAKEYDLAAYVGQVIKIRIIGNWTSGDYDLAFDNIKVALPPYWTGAISSNWATPGNWSEGTVPTGVINALITASYTNAPIINEDKTTPAICNNLTIENGAVLTIAADKGLTVNGNIINNGTVHIESTVTGDGSLLTTGTISGTGIYNVDRYLQESMWHLVTSPIVGAQSGVMHGIWLRPYDEATNTFGAYIVPDNTPMPTGQGFSVWTNTANEIRTFAGTVNDGAQGPWSVQLTGSASANTGWNLIGNPYPSAIDWNAASGWTKNSIGGTIYLWNQTQYATFNGTVGTNQGSNFIAMGQGFFVQASAPGANISLNDNVRVHNAIPFRDEVEVPDVIRINVEGNSSSDEAVIYHVDGSDDSYDFNYDATKLYGNSSAPQLYTKKQENMLAINSMSNLQNLDGKLVYLEVGEVGEYMITYNHNLIEYSNVMMKDLATNAVIYPNHNYVFTAQPDDDDARFEFFFDLTNIEPESSDNISVWAFSNILHVEVPQNQTISNIALYDMQGKLVMTFTDKVKDLSGLAPAIYVVKVNAGENTVVEKVIVK